MVSNLYLLGAGFTRSVFSNAPLNHEVLEALARENPHSWVHELHRRYPGDDVELSLTRLDVDRASSGDSDLDELRSGLEGELACFFRKFNATRAHWDRVPWIRRLCDEVIQNEDAVISLNYDCAIEGFLDLCGKWTPNGGYGANLYCPLGAGEYTPSSVTVLKVHGSANFVIAPSLDNPTAQFVGFEVNDRVFPISGLNREYGVGLGRGRHYIIAPSYVKVPVVEIASLMLEAVSAAQAAERLVVVGCGLRPEDAFLRLVITRFFQGRSRTSKRLVVLDPNASSILGRISEFWGGLVEDQLSKIECGLEDAVDQLVEYLG